MDKSEVKKKEFEEIAFQYMDLVHGAAIRMIENKDDAQDLVQDTYLKAYQFFDKFEKGTDFRAWLFTIFKNTFINEYKKRLKTPPMLDIVELAEILETEGGMSPEDEFFYNILADEMTQIIDELPEKFRLTVTLSDLQGLSYKEVADILNIPIGTVMSRLHRGRRRLRKSLKRAMR